MRDFFVAAEVDELVGKFGEERVALEAAELRLEALCAELARLRYAHSPSRRAKALAQFGSPDFVAALHILGFDPDYLRAGAEKILAKRNNLRTEFSPGRPRKNQCGEVLQ